LSLKRLMVEAHNLLFSPHSQLFSQTMHVPGFFVFLINLPCTATIAKDGFFINLMIEDLLLKKLRLCVSEKLWHLFNLYK
jgi:hypothetical protein